MAFYGLFSIAMHSDKDILQFDEGLPIILQQ